MPAEVLGYLRQELQLESKVFEITGVCCVLAAPANVLTLVPTGGNWAQKARSPRFLRENLRFFSCRLEKRRVAMVNR